MRTIAEVSTSVSPTHVMTPNRSPRFGKRAVASQADAPNHFSRSLSNCRGVELAIGVTGHAAFAITAEWKLRDSVTGMVAIIDVDGFRDIRDLLGRDTSEHLLALIAARLRLLAGPDAAVAHLGGDEFAIFSPKMLDARAALQVVTALLKSLRRTYKIDQASIVVGVSIGVAMAPFHGQDIAELLAAAEIALCSTKRRGGDAIGFFEPHLRHGLDARRHLQAELSDALREGQFELLYQPQVDLARRRIVGVEALLRWNHPARGQLAPTDFIDVLNQLPLAREVGDWVLEQAVRQASAWRREGRPIRVAANLFAAQFRDGRLADRVMDMVRCHGLPPELLELELTEMTVIDRRNGVVDALKILASHGVSVALDDFGTGHASLSLLKTLPISRLKIDRSFVADLTPGSFDATLVAALVAIGGKLGVAVLAEGIENGEQEACLIACGCHEAQGFAFGRPMLAEAIADLRHDIDDLYGRRVSQAPP